MEGPQQNTRPPGDTSTLDSMTNGSTSSWLPTSHPSQPTESQSAQPNPSTAPAQHLQPELHLNIGSLNGSTMPFESPLETPSAAPAPPAASAGPSRINLRPARKPPNNLTMGLEQSQVTQSRLRRGGGGVPRPPPGQSSKASNVKIKLNLGSGGKGKGDGRLPSFLGDYDRELDENPDEPLAFEEQFILRVPERLAGGANGLREMVKGKGKGLEGVEFKFLDSRRAAFRLNGVTYASKLVDLPCIVESQKTHDSRHLFKVADISQMLVVEHPIKDESTITSAPLKVDDYIWPHGLTPPLRHVRKRRFRKRMSRRAIEVVEEQVEELLKKDKEAEGAPTLDFIEAHPDPDIPDSYYIDYDPDAQWHHGGTASEFGGSEMYDDPGSNAPSDWDNVDLNQTPGQQSRDESGEDDLDEELAAALMEQMERGSDGSGSEDGLSASEDDDDEDAEKSEEDDDETAEKKARIRQLTSEIKALEGAVEKKRAGFTGGNPIIQKRFDETIAGLRADIKTKMETRQGLVDEIDQAVAEKRERRRSTVSAAKRPTVPAPAGRDVEMDVDADGDGEGDDDDLPTPAGPVAATPGVDSAPPTPADAEVSYDDGEEDLFGDSEAEVDEGPEEEKMEGADASAIQLLDQQQDVPMIGGEDEMAAMLQAELGDLPSSPQPDFAGMESPQEGLNEREQADVNAALEDMRNLASSPVPDLGGFGFGVEGGVGMRRLVVEDDEEDSSDDSDDD